MCKFVIPKTRLTVEYLAKTSRYPIFVSEENITINREAWEPCKHCKPQEYPPNSFEAHAFHIAGDEIYYHDTNNGWEGEKNQILPILLPPANGRSVGGVGEESEGIAMSEEYKVSLCKHAVGMGMRKPYKRHGKMFYRPYRNYFAASDGSRDFEAWETLEKSGYAKSIRRTEYGKIFWLTRCGLDWLGEKLNMHIYDEED